MQHAVFVAGPWDVDKAILVKSGGSGPELIDKLALLELVKCPLGLPVNDWLLEICNFSARNFHQNVLDYFLSGIEVTVDIAREVALT